MQAVRGFGKQATKAVGMARDFVRTISNGPAKVVPVAPDLPL
jgi:hypothetical protein